MSKKLFFCIVLSSVFRGMWISHAWADVIGLTNNDRITVTTLAIKDNKIFATNNILGAMVLPFSKIKSIQFRHSYWVRLKGETVFHFISNKQPVTYILGSTHVLAPKERNLFSIAELNNTPPVPTYKKNNPPKNIAIAPDIKGKSEVAAAAITAESLAKSPKNTWLFTNKITGYIDFQNIGSKTTNTKVLSGSGTHQARNNTYRHTLTWSVSNTDTNGINQAKNTANYNFNYFVSSKMFYALNTNYIYDDAASPYEIISLGLGAGYQIYDNDATSLSIEAGPGYSGGSYRNADNFTSPSAYGKLNYTQQLTHNISLYNNTQINFIFNSNSLKITGLMGLKYMIKENLWLELSHEYSWDNKPDPDFNSYNGDIKFGVGVSW